MSSRLTVYFIVEPPRYELMACYLAGSLRQQFGKAVALVGYCPDDKIATVSKDVLAVLAKLECEVRPFKVAGRFSPDYPHGNKILATLEPRVTEFSAFFDSDILCLRPNAVENIIKDGHVSLTPAASMVWGSGKTWNMIYETCGMPLPEGRVKLMRQKGDRQRLPYFSSGLFSFPEQHRNAQGQSFPEVWMDVAQTIDRNDSIMIVFPESVPTLTKSACRSQFRNRALRGTFCPKSSISFWAAVCEGNPCRRGARFSRCITESGRS
jgi:hypothetical protein